ncbi:hypothetical protein [Nocardia donostiensis]|uniref:Uncharacterized protein n=1 Tax=Nocardia donostiensis TaxID=1538463 RepID=A0A1V2TEX9_9NOCA|nr:hypothetical protein [Nocardia donostiensis]ONM48055.1 hypothetical protein B0T46_13585 [Nocardia donostiensis]OQS20286.1 hypothetical protein B0T44_10245 [Nocardia donostiensis]
MEKEYAALVDAYLRVEDRYSTSAWDCRANAAPSRLVIGHIAEGFAALHILLDEVIAATGDGSDHVLELRLEIGELLSNTDKAAARAFLEPLYDDLCLIKGPDDELSQCVAELLKNL